MANSSDWLRKAALRFGCGLAMLFATLASSGVEAATLRAKSPHHRAAVVPAAKPATRQQLLTRLRALPREAFRAPPPKAAAPAAAAILVRPAAVAPPVAPPALLTVRPDAPVLLAQRGDWSVFRAVQGDARTCFAATQPKDSMPKLPNRTPVYLYLTSYSPAGIRDELTVKLGFAAPPGSSLTATINGRGYRLAAKGDMAFPADAGSQRTLLDAMRHGASLQLQTVARDGSQTMTDAFSLLGLAAALQDSGSCLKTVGN